MQGSLPAGWEECFDASSGRAYYKNHATQTTSWERPGSMNVYSAPAAATGFAPSPYASPYGGPPAPTVYPASWDSPAPAQQYSGFAPPPQESPYVDYTPYAAQPQPPANAYVYPQVAYQPMPPPQNVAIVVEHKAPPPVVIALQSPIIVSSGLQRVHFQAARGHYVCADMQQGGLLFANRKSAKGWETFILEDHGGLTALVCERRYDWELFEIVQVGSGKVAIRCKKGKFLCAEQGGGTLVTATRQSIGKWEVFDMIVC